MLKRGGKNFMILRHGPILDPFCHCASDLYKNRVEGRDFIYPPPIVAAPILLSGSLRRLKRKVLGINSKDFSVPPKLLGAAPTGVGQVRK
jgi:hypothetical protein